MLISSCLFAFTESLLSPDGKIKVLLDIDKNVAYSVEFNGKKILDFSKVNLKINKDRVVQNFEISKIFKSSVNEKYTPIIPVKTSKICDNYNEIKIIFKNKLGLIFRAYNDGIAYRWFSNIKGNIKIYDELVEYSFMKDYNLWFPEDESFYTHQEKKYKYMKLSDIDDKKMSYSGVLINMDEGVKVFLTEADLYSYPGIYFTGDASEKYKLKGIFPHYPLETEQTSDRDVKILKRADFIAEVEGKRFYPWRVMIITAEDGKLVESQMIWKLAKPCSYKDVDWIKPGKVAWDWWNALNIYGVDFKSGINTETYKYYIDFAAKNGLEYILLDEGWYDLKDVMKVKDSVDLQEIIEYAKSKNVGVVLWVTWKALYDKIDTALAWFEKLGVKGIKVDFMQRDDQQMVDYYWNVARKAFKHHLIVDFHGAYQPKGLRRTFPNVLTREGVLGLEHSKWDVTVDPEHNVTIPFTRMVCGPMDFTPGGMRNATKKDFSPIFDNPMVLGTRCHQLAMFVVFESPLQMLADSPSRYMSEKDALDFLSVVPTVWDTTIVLDAKVSDYIIVARKNGNKWFLAGMTDWSSRTFEIDLSFLPEDGDYLLDLWRDGINADRIAIDYKRISKIVNKRIKLKIDFAPGGGFVAILRHL